jgi:hypothetical protein
MDKKWMKQLVNMMISDIPQEQLAFPLDGNQTGTFDVHGALLSLRTELNSEKVVYSFTAKCGESKKRRVLREKNFVRLEEFSIEHQILTKGKNYKVTIEEVV